MCLEPEWGFPIRIILLCFSSFHFLLLEFCLNANILQRKNEKNMNWFYFRRQRIYAIIPIQFEIMQAPCARCNSVLFLLLFVTAVQRDIGCSVDYCTIVRLSNMYI